MKESDVQLSILVSLVDHREEAIPCIDALTLRQDADEGDYEIIVISDGSEPRMDHEISSMLRDRDHFVTEPSSNEYRLFNAGAKIARGDVMVVIESHCVAEKGFVSAFLEAFRDPELQAARCRSVGVAKSTLEHFEREMFEASFEAGLTKNSWNRVLIHGFGIRRELFLRLGGFREASENFGPWELGARLHREGEQIEYLDLAVVFHRYMGNEEDLRQFIVRFSRAEWEYLVNGDRELIRRYFPRVPEWECQGQSSRAQAKAIFGSRAAWHALLHDTFRGPRQVSFQTAKLALKRLFPFERHRRNRYLRESHSAWARAEANGDRDDFVSFWKLCVELGRWSALVEYQSHVHERLTPGVSLAAGEIDPRSLYGAGALHESEHYRWLEPFAAFSMETEAEVYSLSVDLARAPHGEDVFLYLDRMRIRGHFPAGTHRQIVFPFPAPVSGKTTLILLSPPIPEQETGNQLGLALESIRFDAGATSRPGP